MKPDCDPYSWLQGLVQSGCSVKKKKEKNQVEINNVQGLCGQGYESLQHQHSDREVPPFLPWEREKDQFRSTL